MYDDDYGTNEQSFREKYIHVSEEWMRHKSSEWQGEARGYKSVANIIIIGIVSAVLRAHVRHKPKTFALASINFQTRIEPHTHTYSALNILIYRYASQLVELKSVFLSIHKCNANRTVHFPMQSGALNRSRPMVLPYFGCRRSDCGLPIMIQNKSH